MLLADHWLSRLESGECSKPDQQMAARMLKDALERNRAELEAARKAAYILATGLDAERMG